MVAEDVEEAAAAAPRRGRDVLLAEVAALLNAADEVRSALERRRRDDILGILFRGRDYAGEDVREQWAFSRQRGDAQSAAHSFLAWGFLFYFYFCGAGGACDGAEMGCGSGALGLHRHGGTVVLPQFRCGGPGEMKDECCKGIRDVSHTCCALYFL
jgi:hypothetical protein